MDSLIETIKKAAVGAVEAGYPVAVMLGVVISPDPLRIDIEQKKELDADQLILTRNVTEYTVEMSVDHETEDETAHIHAVIDTYTGGGSSSPTTHRHGYRGTKSFTVHNTLKAGDKVILLRVQGGQKYIVLDREG